MDFQQKAIMGSLHLNAKNKKVLINIKTYMLPVAELLSVGREPLERSIWANLREEHDHQ